MENVAKATLSYSRISPRKVKIVIDLIRNKPVGTALAILKNTPKAASPLVEKLLLSAMANAENNHGMDVENLYVAEVYSNAGPILKRIRPRAQGRAFRIYKRTSHTTIVLKERETVAAPVAEEKPAKARKPRASKKKAEETAE
jgi:large subunit ribosomal protein L22